MNAFLRACRNIGLGIVATLGPSWVAASDSVSWRVSDGDVRVVCPMTVGGSFEAKTSMLDGLLTEESSGASALAGAVAVDLTTLDTGIDLRDDHLRNEYLEVGRGDEFAKAVLGDIQLGGGDLQTPRGEARFSGTLLLHGVKKTVSGQAKLRRRGSGVQVEASFPLVLADFGIARPQYLGIGVKDEVEAKVHLLLSPEMQTGVTR